MNRLSAFAVLLCIILSVVLGCSSPQTGVVRIACTQDYEAFETLAALYSSQTGVETQVRFIESADYEASIADILTGDEAPSIFPIFDSADIGAVSELCADLGGSQAYELLSDKSIAVLGAGKVCALPADVEGYGIIYNKKILNAYLSTNTVHGSEGERLDGDINSFDDLKLLVESMTRDKELLGIGGVFASTSMATSGRWRFTTQLLNIPLYYEFSSEADPFSAISEASSIEFAYSQNYRDIFDLYLNNSTTPKDELIQKSVNDSMAEFALGKCVMVQNGDFSLSQIVDVTGSTVTSADIGFIPIYMGIEGEERRGLCVSVKTAFAVNDSVSADDKDAAMDFISWMFTNEEAMRCVVNDLGYTAAFSGFENIDTGNVLSNELLKYLSDDELSAVPVIYTAFPSEDFVDDVGVALLAYTNGRATWDEVADTVRNAWPAYALTRQG